jgi:hypothetical protein
MKRNPRAIHSRAIQALDVHHAWRDAVFLAGPDDFIFGGNRALAVSSTYRLRESRPMAAIDALDAENLIDVFHGL